MKLWPFLLVAALVAAVSLSGCVGAFKVSPTPTPTPVPATPVPTPLPTDNPGPIGTEHSTQLRLSNVTVTLAPTSNQSLQAENFTLTFENTGTSPVENAAFNFRETDLRRGWQVFSDEYLVGTIPGHSQVAYNLTTAPHREAFSVVAEITLYWGDKVQYSNSYRKSFTLVGLPTGA